MNTVEERLREALRERARHSPIDPGAWEQTIARTRRRARASVWSRFMIPAAAAAVVVVIVAAAAVLTGHGGVRGGPGKLASASPTPPPPPGRGNYLIQQAPPISAIVSVKTTSGGRASWTFVWFGYEKIDRAEGPVLCEETYTGRSDDGGGCGLTQIPSGQAGTSSGGLGDIRLGVSAAKVVSVVAQLPGGRTVPGVVVSGRGFPHRVWAVRYPSADNATIVFRDGAGHGAGHLFIQGSPPFPPRPRSGGIAVFRYPAGPEGPKPGTMTAYLVGGKVGFWNSDGSDSSISNVPAAGPPAVGLFQGMSPPKAKAVEFYGYAHRNVARVVLRLAGGRQYGAQTFAAWPRSGLGLWAFSVPARYLTTGNRSKDVWTGYDAAGHVAWQKTFG
jgi:hypothetical protein